MSVNDYAGKKDEKEPERRLERTECCGVGSYASEYFIYLIQNPMASQPTQTDVQIGEFIGCSRCAGPIGQFKMDSKFSLPSNVLEAMIKERRNRGGKFSYWAQINQDGSIGLYDWQTHPMVKRMNQSKKLIASGQYFPFKSAEAAKNAALAKTTEARRSEDGYSPESPEFPEEGDAQEQEDQAAGQSYRGGMEEYESPQGYRG